MKRKVLGLVTVLVLASVQFAEAQQPVKIPRIGFFSSTSPSIISARVVYRAISGISSAPPPELGHDCFLYSSDYPYCDSKWPARVEQGNKAIFYRSLRWKTFSPLTISTGIEAVNSSDF